MPDVRVISVAIKCHDLDAMLAFYSEAFGGSFREVDVGGGMLCQFGKIGEATFKLVSGREEAPDFEGYPIHQLGLSVPDVERVIELAKQHGGRQEGDVLREGGEVFGCVRDPDGNTIELALAPRVPS